MTWRGETQTKLTLCGGMQDAVYILQAKNSDTVMTRGWSCYGWGASRWDLTCLNLFDGQSVFELRRVAMRPRIATGHKITKWGKDGRTRRLAD